MEDKEITKAVKELFLKGYSMTLKPTLNRVVVTRDEAGGKTEGGILLPDSAKGKSSRGTVVSAGPGRHHEGKFIETTLKAGDKVLFTAYAGTEVELDRKTYLIMDDSEILATLA